MYQKFGLKTTDSFIGATLMNNSSLERLQNALTEWKKENTQGKTVELMIHPGYSSPGVGDDFSQSMEREREMELMKDTSLQEFLMENGWVVVSWRGITLLKLN